MSTKSVASMPSTRRRATRCTGMRAISTRLLLRAPSVALLLLGVVVLGRHHARRQLAEEVIVECGPRDRRRGARTEAAVFHDHRERDLRAVDGGEGDEPGMVAQALRDLRLVVLLVLL